MQEKEFLERFEVQPNGCWLWKQQSRHQHGYVKFGRVYAHRWSYEQYNGPIPEGFTVDHECHNQDVSCVAGDDCPHRRCVNPKHLAARTQGGNNVAALNRPRKKMARKITGLTARDQHVTARLRADTVFDLDKMRGPTPRSRFLEYLIAQEKRRRDQLKDGK